MSKWDLDKMVVMLVAIFCARVAICLTTVETIEELKDCPPCECADSDK